MRVTISKNKEWYRGIRPLRACHLIGCKGWQLESALEAHKPLKGWTIRKTPEIYKGVYDK